MAEPISSSSAPNHRQAILTMAEPIIEA